MLIGIGWRGFRLVLRLTLLVLLAWLSLLWLLLWLLDWLLFLLLGHGGLPVAQSRLTAYVFSADTSVRL